jgi:hypothetical protein
MRGALFGFCLGAIGAALTGPAGAASKSAEPASMAANPAMWTVHGSKAVIYMLGSVHALPKNVNWQTPKLMAAMRQADVFVFEVPMNAESRTKAADFFRTNAILPGSIALPSLFDAQMRADFRDVVMLTHADPTYVVYMRPWLAALVLEGAASGGKGLYSAEGVDNKVYAAAKARGVTRFRALERDEDQFHLFFRDGHIKDEVADLRLTFKDILAHHGAQEKDLLAAWAKGDAQALARLVPENKGTSPAFRKTWIEARNRKWVPEIEAMLNEPHIFFITVGAAHLVGKTGVPNLLRADGIRVDGP